MGDANVNLNVNVKCNVNVSANTNRWNNKPPEQTGWFHPVYSVNLVDCYIVPKVHQ